MHDHPNPEVVLEQLSRGIDPKKFRLPVSHRPEAPVVSAGGYKAADVDIDEARKLVRRLYHSILAREVDATGTEFWGHALASGQHTRAGLVEALRATPEYQSTMVPLAHLVLAATDGRMPELGPFMRWARRLRDGEPIVDVAAELASKELGGDREAARNAEVLLARAASPEHHERNGARAEVMLLNLALLERLPDEPSLARWLPVLGSAGGSARVIEGLLDSDEFRKGSLATGT